MCGDLVVTPVATLRSDHIPNQRHLRAVRYKVERFAGVVSAQLKLVQVTRPVDSDGARSRPIETRRSTNSERVAVSVTNCRKNSVRLGSRLGDGPGDGPRGAAGNVVDILSLTLRDISGDEVQTNCAGSG